MLKIVGSTHIGRRELNEDSFIADDKLGLAAVADGMGGYSSGEVASAIVVSTLWNEINKSTNLADAISLSHLEVKKGVLDGRGGAGMGSTVIAAHFKDNKFDIAWVGDSRAYIWDGTELRQISRDHSYVESLLSRGIISPEDAKTRNDRNLVTQAIGADALIEVDIGQVSGDLYAGEQLLLCSDGLNDALSGFEIARTLKDHEASSQEERCERLVNASYDAGGKDNITVLLMSNDVPVPTKGRHQAPPVEIHTLSGHSQYYPLTAINDDADITGSDSVTAEYSTTQVYAVKPKSQLDYDALEDHVGGGPNLGLWAAIGGVILLLTLGLLFYLGIIGG